MNTFVVSARAESENRTICWRILSTAEYYSVVANTRNAYSGSLPCVFVHCLHLSFCCDIPIIPSALLLSLPSLAIRGFLCLLSSLMPVTTLLLASDLKTSGKESEFSSTTHLSALPLWIVTALYTSLLCCKMWCLSFNKCIWQRNWNILTSKCLNERNKDVSNLFRCRHHFYSWTKIPTSPSETGAKPQQNAYAGLL